MEPRSNVVSHAVRAATAARRGLAAGVVDPVDYAWWPLTAVEAAAVRSGFASLEAADKGSVDRFTGLIG